MIFGILVIGLVLIASALKNTQHELGAQIATDVLGTDGFVAWAGAIMGIGAVGYIPGFKGPSRALLGLLLVVLVVRNGGLFSQLEAGIQGAEQAGPAPSIPTPSIAADLSGGGSSSSSGSSGSDYEQYAEIAAIALA